MAQKVTIFTRLANKKYFRGSEAGKQTHGWERGYTKARQNVGDTTDVSLIRQPLNLQGSTSCSESQMAAASPNPFIASPRHLKSQKSATWLA